MDLRLALYQTAAEHRLGAAATSGLEESAGLGAAPVGLVPRLTLGLALLGAALCGLGLVFWVAAHWPGLGRAGRFALLQSTVAGLALGAWAWPGAREPLALLAWLGTGALFACCGQAYPTGAAPWQLFALWAGLSLPLGLGLRSDALWACWALVAMTAVALWVQAHTGQPGRAAPHDLPVHGLGWVLALALAAALGPGLQRFTGAGPWALRTALTLSVLMIVASALGALFQPQVGAPYVLGLALLGQSARVVGF